MIGFVLLGCLFYSVPGAISFITYCMNEEEDFLTNGLVVKEVVTRIAN